MITVTLSGKDYDTLRKCRKCRNSLMRKYYKPNTPIQIQVGGRVVLTFTAAQIEEVYAKYGKIK